MSARSSSNGEWEAERLRLSEDIARLASLNSALKDELLSQSRDLAATQKHAQMLQNRLQEVTPLRRHIKRFIRYRIQRIDHKISGKLAKVKNYSPLALKDNAQEDVSGLLSVVRQNDKVNFEQYNEAVKQRIPYRAYNKLKRHGIEGVNRLIHAHRKKGRHEA